MLKKIVIIGPESTGKSFLCQALAQAFNTRWCPEFAREYLLQHGNHYGYEDLLTIAQGQLAQEDACVAKGLEQQKPVVFIDTDMQVMRVWCEFGFGKCHPYILNQIIHRKYDLYLLCNTDLPWTQDALREYPDLSTRQVLFKMYQEILINQSTPWVEITGTAQARVNQAIEAVRHFLRQSF